MTAMLVMDAAQPLDEKITITAEDRDTLKALVRGWPSAPATPRPVAASGADRVRQPRGARAGRTYPVGSIASSPP